MQIFQAIVPFIIGLMVVISVPTVPAGAILFVLSFTSKEEQKKKDYRKISYYLFAPLLVIFVLVFLWGLVGFVEALK